MDIILDTDFLLNSLKNKIDIFSEFSRILDEKFKVNILDKTLDELKGKNLEKLCIAFINAKNINIIKTDRLKNVDNLILDLVGKDTIVATQDKDLKRKLKKKNIQVITIRQKKYLAI